LRSYDGQIGKFLQNDPYDQFASSYTGMGNDPINNIDPSGGWIFSTVGLIELGIWTAIGAAAGAVIGGATNGWDPKSIKNGAAIGGGIGLGASFVNWGTVGNWFSGLDLNFANWALNHGSWFLSSHAAAYDWGKNNNGPSISDNTERASFIYSKTFKVKKERVTFYKYTEPDKGEKGKYKVLFPTIKQNFKLIPKNATPEAFIHSHGDFTSRNDVENFSPDGGLDENGHPKGDRGVIHFYNIDGYVTTPSGKLKYTRPGINMQKDICDCLTDFKGRAIKAPTKTELNNFSNPNWKPQVLISQ
jgi:hypothetical protein